MLNDFEVGEEIGWGEESVVYQAHKKTEPARELALKIRRVADEAQGQELLDAAQDQETATKANCRWIVNLVASGSGVGETYHVTPRYPRSLQTLIQGKVTIHPEGLLHLSESALAALRDLLTKVGRAHGNLKPSNVLLTGTSQLRESGIFLTDLGPSRRAQTTDDLQALGRCIFSLVRKREVDRFDWPLNLTTEWKALGSLGGDWLKFTNVLLDPGLGRKGEPLAIAEKALVQLQKRHGGLSGLLPLLKVGAIGAAVLAVIGGVGFTAWQIAHRSGGEVVMQESTSAPDEWFGNLALELNAKPKWVSADPYLNEKVIKPTRALDLRDREANLLRQAELPPDANARVRAAAAALPGIRQNLDAWEARVSLQRNYAKFKQLGWTFSARALERLVAADLGTDRPILEQFQDIEASSKLAAEIDAKWQQFQKLGDTLEETNDPVLRGGLGWAAAEAGKGQNLYDLKARLDTLLKRLQADLQLLTQTDRKRFKSEANLPEVRGDLTSATLDEWERQAKRFQPARDEADRLRTAWGRRFDALSAKASRVKGPEGAAWQDKIRRTQQESESTLSTLLAGEGDDVSSRTNAALDALERQGPADSTAVAMTPVNPPPTIPVPATPTPMVGRSTPPPPDRGSQDQQAWAQILATARNLDFNNATVEQAKAARDNLVSSVYRQTSTAFQGKAGNFLASLNALSFAESAGPAGAPKLPGWEGPAPVAGGVGYRFGNYTMEFVLIPADGGNAAFYLSRFETPVGLVVDWVNNRGGGAWAALGIRTNTSVSGPRVWATQGAGIAVRTDGASPWSWPTSLTNQLPFYAVPPTVPPSPTMPLNYVSANSAAALAAAFGGRLPTTEEWQRPARLQLRNLESAQRNLRDQSWDEQRKYIAKSVGDLKARGTELPDPPWPDGDIFLPSNVTVPRRANAVPAVDANDKTLWFAPVTQGEPGRLVNLIGNVAEFVADPEGSGAPRMSVIGGSALSPREIDPNTPYALNPAQRLAQYSDVGFRLALSSAGGGGSSRRDIVAFQQLLQNPPTF